MAGRPRTTKTGNTPLARGLERLRGDKKITDFADFLGVNRASLNDYLAGLVPISVDNIRRIIEVTGCNARALLTGEGDLLGPEQAGTVAEARAAYDARHRSVRLVVNNTDAGEFELSDSGDVLEVRVKVVKG